MPATTADRIRECLDAADDVLRLAMVMIDKVDADLASGKKRVVASDTGVAIRLCELWDSAYKAGRQDATR